MNKRIAIVVAAILVLTAGVALAASVCPLPLKALLASATRVVELRVETTEVQADNGQAFTLATCAVSRTFKGPANKQVIVRVPGGKIGGFTMIVPGVPTLKAGDRYIAFLTPREGQAAQFQPLGLGQGLFALVEKQGKTYAIQTISRAPYHFRECADAPETCLRRLGVMAAEHTAFVTDLQAGLAEGNSP